MLVRTLTDAAGSLAYAAAALEAPHGSHMRTVLRELGEARAIVDEMIGALDAIVELERCGGSAQGMRMIAQAALDLVKE